MGAGGEENIPWREEKRGTVGAGNNKVPWGWKRDVPKGLKQDVLRRSKQPHRANLTVLLQSRQNKRPLIHWSMEFAGKRRQSKDQFKENSAKMDNNARILASRVHVAGPEASSSKKQVRPKV